jgi:hypothetical protein
MDEQQAQTAVNFRELVDPQKILVYLKGKIDFLEEELGPLRIAFCKAVAASNLGDADVFLEQIISKQSMQAACAEEYVRGTAYEAALANLLETQGSEPVN